MKANFKSLLLPFFVVIATTCFFTKDVESCKPVSSDIVLGSINSGIQPVFPSNCEEGDTIKVCVKVIYWRDGDGVPYTPVTGNNYGWPVEINFWTTCTTQYGNGTQTVFYENLYEGEYVELEIVAGWCIEWGLVWLPPSIVCGQPSPLGRWAEIGIFDENCDVRLWPDNAPLSLCPIAQQEPNCPSCPLVPAPDLINYTYVAGYHQGAKKVEAYELCD